MAKAATSLSLAGLILVAANLALAVSAATTHTVGGNSGWTIPSTNSDRFYSDWASNESFAVGDTLVFTFPNGVHNVIEVPRASFNSCSTANQIGSTSTVSPASLTISTAGMHYYICGFPGHCLAGQRLAITASSSSASSPTAAATAPIAPGPGGSSSTVPSASGPGGPAPGSGAISVPSLAFVALSSLLASQFLF